MEKREEEEEVVEKAKVVVIMGPTGAGKSRLAIDLASRFPVDIINADSMQVYRGLDVLTNKVPFSDQNGVPHHLLGTVNPSVEFTAKEFRDAAIPGLLACCFFMSGSAFDLVSSELMECWEHEALVSPFLLDDTAEDFGNGCLNHPPGDENNNQALVSLEENINFTHDFLRDLDPVAADRIHPNNHRKINQYLRLYAQSGVLPSKVYQGKAAENWGRIENCRYNCCFLCIDAAIPVLDCYVDHRVDCMVDAGLLGEVYEIYSVNADYSRGLRQAIGVREFEDLLDVYLSRSRDSGESCSAEESLSKLSLNGNRKVFEAEMEELLHSSANSQLKVFLADGVDKVKLNTRRLVRRQKRMLKRLQMMFGWNLHFLDATESLSGKSDEIWTRLVVGPAVEVVRSFLNDERSLRSDSGIQNDVSKSLGRSLWTQYTCEACGNKVLRGDHEWEQHKQGRSHRKRTSRLRKSRAELII